MSERSSRGERSPSQLQLAGLEREIWDKIQAKIDEAGLGVYEGGGYYNWRSPDPAVPGAYTIIYRRPGSRLPFIHDRLTGRPIPPAVAAFFHFQNAEIHDEPPLYGATTQVLLSLLDGRYSVERKTGLTQIVEVDDMAALRSPDPAAFVAELRDPLESQEQRDRAEVEAQERSLGLFSISAGDVDEIIRLVQDA